uniref:Ig-like domain-containing protein n=1 Tax=Callorhinchus milii TaxID=7868 RepID=A0A4W3GAJ6_CALMI
ADFQTKNFHYYFPGDLAESDFSQTPQAVTVNENGNVSIECSTTVNNPFFQWYKQHGKGSIRILVLGKSDVNMKERIRALAERKQKTCTLTIEDVQISDTAIYFCAESTMLCAQISDFALQKLPCGVL